MDIKRIEDRNGDDSDIGLTELQKISDSVRRIGKRESEGLVFVMERIDDHEGHERHSVVAYGHQMDKRKALIAFCAAHGIEDIGRLLERLM